MSIEKITNAIFSEAIGRIQKVGKFTHEYEVANLLGFKKDTFAARKSRGSLPRKEIEIACTNNGWNYDWVMTGLGSMYVGSETPRVQFDDSVQPISDDFILVPRYDVAGSAGGGTLIESEDVLEYLSFRKELIGKSA